MNLARWLPFREIWLLDFEFSVPDGERPRPICLVAHEVLSGKRVRLWEEELRGRSTPPYSLGPDAVFLAYYSSAEWGCHLALGWPLPERVIDLYAEFRNLTNGLRPPCGDGLLGALTYFGLDALAAAEKDSMRSLALRGGPWSADEQRALLDYCESDVISLERLAPHILPHVCLEHALLRGRFMAAAASMEHTGVPIDAERLEMLRRGWTSIQDQLIQDIDAEYGVFEGRTFKQARWEAWLNRNGIPWPRLASGHLALDDDTFREMARAFPAVAPIRELRCSLSQLRLHDLAVGADGRNRALLSAFRAKSSRNAPSTSRFIFGNAVWIRGLIQPRPGWACAYVDYEQQEFGIAAALAPDPAMKIAYLTGDPYLSFAKQAGHAPADATKLSHAGVREQFKACALGVQYGMEAVTLGSRIGKSPAHARELLRLHHETYPDYWRWSDSAVTHAMLLGSLQTTFGWTIRVTSDVNVRTLRNFPMQGNGAEMLRIAIILGMQRHVRICAPVQDAVLIEAPIDEIEDEVARMQQAMSDASAIVLDGFRLRTDAKTLRHPERYADGRGEQMWSKVWRLLGRPSIDGEAA